jgi:hypothetical protein
LKNLPHHTNYKLVHIKRDTLGFRVFIKIIEIHDFSPPVDSDDDSSDPRSDSDGDGLPGSGGSGDILQLPRIYRLAEDTSPARVPWPSLPRSGGDVSGSLLGSAARVRFPRRAWSSRRASGDATSYPARCRGIQKDLGSQRF